MVRRRRVAPALLLGGPLGGGAASGSRAGVGATKAAAARAD